MKSIQTLDELTLALRQMLIQQSELSPDRVLNALSLEGTELDKLLEEQVYESISQNDTTILFQLTALPSESDVSMEEGDKYTAREQVCSMSTISGRNTIVGDFVIDYSITYYKMYRLAVIMYGLASSDLAAKLIARLRSGNARTNLYSSGIYLEEVSNPTTINEFKNNIMWLRNDFDIDIGVKYNISQISLPETFKTVNTLNIIMGGTKTYE